MRSYLLAAAAALCAAGAQAQPAATDPYSAGRELRIAGRPAEAIPLLEAAATASPSDADVWLNLGLAYVAAKRYADAERALDEAQRLAPAYADVAVARARVAFFRGEPAEAERRLAPVLAARPDHAEARTLSDQLAAARDAATAWRLDGTAAHARLSKDLPSQTRGAIALTHTDARRRSRTLLVEQTRQFGLDDTYLEAQLASPRGHLALGGAPGADFRPKWQVRAGLAADPVAAGAGWTAQLGIDAAWARYPVGDVRSLQPALTLARGEGLVLTARWINTLDERDDYRSGYAVRGVWTPAPRLHLSAGWSDAPESSEGLTQDVRAASLGVAVDVTPRLTVRLDGVHETRNAYERDELAVGFIRRF